MYWILPGGSALPDSGISAPITPRAAPLSRWAARIRLSMGSDSSAMCFGELIMAMTGVLSR
ncbi:hypothetical protein ACFWOX_24185 [Streptomyces sp. NPDC058467]|uniref:hypothetical protein n=1 Tax=Streptomyces sp. NPDC058467 TaxID=3346513 RepID=UPI00366390BA